MLPGLEGCGEDAPREGGGTDQAPPPLEAPRTITEADGGESFTLAVGAETALRLSSEYVWSEPTVRGDAVELARVDYLQDPGFSEWLVRALQPGTTTIAAEGTPACAGQEGCADEPLGFQVRITVR
jgi:predicted secreted protein